MDLAMDITKEILPFTILAPLEFDRYSPKRKELDGGVPVRTDPKINRNAICPKCESGLKYKKCCLLTKT